MPVAQLILRHAGSLRVASELLRHCFGDELSPNVDDLDADSLGGDSFIGPVSIEWTPEEATRIAVLSVQAISRLVRSSPNNGTVIEVASRWAVAAAETGRCPPRLATVVLALSCRLFSIMEQRLNAEKSDELVSVARDFVEPLLRLAEEAEEESAIVAATKVLMACDAIEEKEKDHGEKRSRSGGNGRRRKQRTVRSRNAFIDANMTGNEADTFADLEDFIECDETGEYAKQATEAELDEMAEASFKRQKK